MGDNAQDKVFCKSQEYAAEFEKNYSSTLIMGRIIGRKVVDKQKEFLFGVRVYLDNNNELIREINRLHDEYINLIENSYIPYETDKDIAYENIYELARIKSFEEAHERFGVKTQKEWDEIIKINENDLIVNECKRIDKKLRDINNNILSILLKDIGVSEYSLAKIKHKKNESYASSDLYGETDVLFLLECLYDCVGNESKQFKKKEEPSYGRSFLSKGYGVLSHNLRECMCNKFKRFLYLDIKGRELLSSIFVFPRSLLYDIVWETDYLDDICDPFYWKKCRQVVIDFLSEKNYDIATETKLEKKINYINKDYSIADDLYWNMQYRRMQDFCLGMDGCLKCVKMKSNMPKNDEILEEIYVKMYNDSKLDIEVYSNILSVEIIRNIHVNKSFESIRKKYNRDRAFIKRLIDFYDQGCRCYRNDKLFKDDFRHAVFFEYDNDCREKIEKARGVFISTILSVVFELIGMEKVFPSNGRTVGIEDNIHLRYVLSTYQNVSDEEYKQNELFYLPWNFLNEVIEWGFDGAEIINRLRINLMIPYYKLNGVGLVNSCTSGSEEVIEMDDFREELFKGYEKNVNNMCNIAMENRDELIERLKNRLDPIS